MAVSMLGMSSQNLQVPPGISTENPLAAPHPAAFPHYPQSWYLACASSALSRGKARAIQLCGRSLVIFRTKDGHVGALSARCPHLGSDLANGQVVGDSIACPYHHFRFNREGQCRQHGLHSRAYPVEERFGAVFIFLGARPAFPLPTFGVTDLVSAPPLHWRLNTQWYMVGANAFDARHFSLAHGRRLVGPAVLSPAERFCLRVRYEYAIDGTSLPDRAVRLLSGARAIFHVAAWGGNLMMVRAQFARDESLGVVAVEPDGDRAAKVTVIVSARRSGTVLGALLGDWLRARLKRLAIRNFLEDDSRPLQKLDYVHGGLCPGDETLAAFLRWQATLCEADNEQEDRHENR
jgi:nitrite reductase/ring-hydroxylating ferredoxin subunit